jgi:predicted transcriptional regulator
MAGESIALNILKILLNTKGMLTQEIISELKKTRDLKVDPDASVSENLKKLQEKEIIERESTPKPGRGPDPKFTKLKTDYVGFKKVVEYIFNIKNQDVLHKYKKIFINSSYAKENINMDLVNGIENNLNNALEPAEKIEFNEREREKILNILQSSASAIHYAFIEPTLLLEWYIVENEQDILKFKQAFITRLLLRLGEDLLSDTTNTSKKFNFGIYVEFSDIERFPKIIIDDGKIESIFHHSFED